MRNDEQSAQDIPRIIHGAEISARPSMMNYGKKLDVLVPFDRIGLKKKFEWLPWWGYLFVDSGAFSVSQKTAAIQLKEYIFFLKEYGHMINHYASLDVVGDGSQSLHNWRIMRKQGLYPIPVYHDGEPLEILEEYADNCSYIGLGAVAYKSSKSRQIFFDRVFSMYPDRTKVGFHGFGVFHLGYLQRYPWRSVDASSVSTCARFGRVFWNWQTVGISERMDNKNIRQWHSDYNEAELKKKFIEYGRDYEVAKKGDKFGVEQRTFFSLDWIEEYVKIPQTYNPTFSVTSLL